MGFWRDVWLPTAVSSLAIVIILAVIAGLVFGGIWFIVDGIIPTVCGETPIFWFSDPCTVGMVMVTAIIIGIIIATPLQYIRHRASGGDT